MSVLIEPERSKVEKGSIPAAKEILFLPAPKEDVVEVEACFRNEGVRFSWVEDHQELIDRVKAMQPFLLVLDLFRLDVFVFGLFPKIEDCLGDCKTIIFGRDRDFWTLQAKPAKNVVFFEDALEAPVLLFSLARILRDGWGFFRRNSVSKNPYYLLFCHSDKMEKIKAFVDQVAPTDIATLIRGERGTGKDLVAQAIHLRSSRCNKPFIKVNCAAVGGRVLESELLGFENGAFTGAYGWKPGKLELANQGTIYFDEIGDLEGSLQARLLRVLQDGVFSRLGGKDDMAFDARVISCTKSDLQSAVEAGRFREDLYYRLNVASVLLPPLRERKEEIPSLTKYFLNLYNLRYGRSYPSISEETAEVFLSHDWPGNIGELQHTIKRIVILNDEAPVARDMRERKREILGAGASASPMRHHGERRGNLREVGRRAAKEAEKVVIQKMLEQTRWNRRETAELLQISYKALLYKIKEYCLDQ